MTFPVNFTIFPLPDRARKKEKQEDQLNSMALVWDSTKQGQQACEEWGMCKFLKIGPLRTCLHQLNPILNRFDDDNTK